MATRTYAYCDANGVIEFGPRIPEGRLPVAHTIGNPERFKQRVAAVARLAHDGTTLLVPGVPEAPDQTHGVDALLKFRSWITTENGALKRTR